MWNNPNSDTNPDYTSGHEFWENLTGVSGQRTLADEERAFQEYWYNEYQSPAAMVQQYRDAGLNPNMLNGAGTSTPPSVSTPSAKGGADVLADVAGAVQGVGSLAQGAQTIQQNAKRLENDIDISQFGKRLTEAQTYAAFMKGGFDSELAMGAAISNYWANSQNIADLAIKRQNRANMEKEWFLIQANTDFVNKQIARYDEMIDAELDLKQKQSLEAERHSFQMEQNVKQTQLENDFFERWNYHSDAPVDVALRNRWQSGEFSEYDTMLDFVLDYGYKMSYGQGLGNAVSSRFGKMNIYEIPYEICNRVEDLLKGVDYGNKVDSKIKDSITSDLNALGDILKEAFDSVQEDNPYTNSEANGKPFNAQ